MKKNRVILSIVALAINSAKADLNSFVRQQDSLNQQAQMEGLRAVVIVVFVIGIVVFVIWKSAKKKR